MPNPKIFGSAQLMTLKVYVKKGRLQISGQQLWLWKIFFCTQQLVEVGFCTQLDGFLTHAKALGLKELTLQPRSEIHSRARNCQFHMSADK